MAHWVTGDPWLQENHMELGVWKYICKLWEEFSQFHHLVVGNGHKISFTEEQVDWEFSSNVRLPQHFSNSQWLRTQQNGEGNSWNIVLRRNSQDWELEVMVRLLATLNNATTNSLAPDQFKWGTQIRRNFKESRLQNTRCTEHNHRNGPWSLSGKSNYPLR